jgi:N6-adenosine-specific RNA methylase IME4
MYVDIFNTDKKYQVILADPPWRFKTYSEAGRDRSADRHYPTQGIEWIKSLPVQKLADRRCALFMWVIDTHLDQGFDVLKAWGFKYKTVGFYWAKLNKSAKKESINADKDFFMGTGYYGRANPEQCLLGLSSDEFEVDQLLLGTTAKAPERKDAGVRKLIVDHRREHSRKPDDTHTRIERLFGDIPRIELFARQERPGWSYWGNEVNKFNDTK